MFYFSPQVGITLNMVFTFGEFKETYLRILKLLYQKDNNGTLLKKPKLSILDGKSFDKVYNNIAKKVNQKDKDVLDKSSIDYVKKELKSYKGKKSPNKLKLINAILPPLENLNTNIQNFLYSKENPKNITTRDLICYSYTLEPHIKNCKLAKDVYDAYQEELKNRSEEEKRINQGTSPYVYDVKHVNDFISHFKWDDLKS